MACIVRGCKKEARLESGIGFRVCSKACASKAVPTKQVVIAQDPHLLHDERDPTLVHIHKDSPMIGYYRAEPSLILRNGKTSLDQCISAQHPDYYQVNKNVAQALKVALFGITREEIEQALQEARREAEEVARKRAELQKQLDEAKKEERKRKMGEMDQKKAAKEAEKERKAEERLRKKEETRKRRNEKAKAYRDAQKAKDARKKATGKQLDELNNDVLITMVAQLDEASLNALASVNKRFADVVRQFKDLRFFGVFDESSPEAKMRFIFFAIVFGNWKRVAYAFSKYDEKSWEFSITDYFAKLFALTSPWKEGPSFSYGGEDADKVMAWQEQDDDKLTASLVEKALDVFIRLVFFKESSLGELQPFSMPEEHRYFANEIMTSLATFHHLTMLNRFFTDPLWSQTIGIDTKLAKQEMMLQATYSGFVAFVAQCVADPTIDITYKNSSVFGIVTGDKYRSQVSDNEQFYESVFVDGPVSIEDELDEIYQLLVKSGRPFEKIKPSSAVPNTHNFYAWDQWWDNDGQELPIVVRDDEIVGPITSNGNIALANCIFHGHTEIIDDILGLHTPEMLANDIDLERMLVYYYTVAYEDRGWKTGTVLGMFERVMKQSNYTLVPPTMAHKVMRTGFTNMYVFPDGWQSGQYKIVTYTSYEDKLKRLRDLLLKDARLTPVQRGHIQLAYDVVIGFATGKEDVDVPEDLEDDFEDVDYESVGARGAMFSNPWKEAADMEM